MEECKAEYYGYSAEAPLKILGQFIAGIEFSGKRVKGGFVVIAGKEENLMSFSTARELGIIHMADEVNKIQEERKRDFEDVEYTTKQLKAKFPSLFSGKLGCVKRYEVKLDIDENGKPIRQKLRPVVFHLREALIKEIRKHVEMGILDSMDESMGPTPWVANLVVVPNTR